MRGGALLALILVVAIMLALMIGDSNLGIADLWRGIVDGTGPGALTIKVIRGPRVATALGAGAMLGVSGAIFQVLLRNPLAAPDVMGFNAGAGLAVLAATSLGVMMPMPLAAAGGGLATAALVVALAYQRGHFTSALTLILVGLGIGFFVSAAGAFLLVSLPPEAAGDAQRWLSGSLSARSWYDAGQIWLIGACLSLALAGQNKSMKLLELGRELAAGLGLRVDLAQWCLIGTAILMATAAVAVAGPVPFIALMAAPAGAAITGAREPGARFAAAGAAGAAIAVLADLAARAAVPHVQLPIGVMTGVFGAPYLLWRLSREMESGKL